MHVSPAPVAREERGGDTSVAPICEAVPHWPSYLLDVERIYLEPAAEQHAHGRAILERFPGAERIPVASHWQIPDLHRNRTLAPAWLEVKRTTLVLGTRKTLTSRENCRSADFVAPGLSNGCAMACAYCYVPRRKGFANPISLFVNTDGILASIERHARRLGPKLQGNQCDPELWVYDIGENGDFSVDAYLHPGARELIERFRDIPNAKASFATKHVNRTMLDWDPRGKTRIRFGLMPQRMAKLVDVRADPIATRIAAIDDFVAAGYEVHINLSPVILYEDWRADYDRLLEQVADSIGARARAQLKAEIIMLTHNEGLHDVNLAWHPKAEDVLWRPEMQQPKRSQQGGWNVRYRNKIKGEGLAALQRILANRLPECVVRYAF